MKVESHTETTIHLFLSEEEALLLREYVQNSFCSNESEESTKMRRELFEALASKLNH